MASANPQPRHAPREIRVQIIADALYLELLTDVERKAKDYRVPTVLDYTRGELYPTDTIPETVRIIHRFGLTGCHELVEDVKFVICNLALEFRQRYEHLDDDVPGDLFEFNWSAEDLSLEEWDKIGSELYHLSHQQLSKLRRILLPLPYDWKPVGLEDPALLPTVGSMRRRIRFAIYEGSDLVLFDGFSSFRQVLVKRAWDSTEEKSASVWYAMKLLQTGLDELLKIGRDMDDIINSRVEEAV